MRRELLDSVDSVGGFFPVRPCLPRNLFRFLRVSIPKKNPETGN